MSLDKLINATGDLVVKACTNRNTKSSGQGCC